ncbi:MAG: sugar ABC transporter permease [Chloroflexota bacterium]|nr:sugar ABC transporter permease [Chloroflexota bacterium]
MSAEVVRPVALEEDQGRYLLDKPGLLGPVMLLPAIIYIFALVAIPLFLAVAYSLSDVTVGDQSIDWAGFENFRAVWGQDTFQTALRNSIKFTLVSQAIVIVLANVLVLVLSQEFPGRRLVRFLVMLPWTTPLALAVIGWRWMLDNVYSPFDAILRSFDLLGPGTRWGPARNMHWLSKENLAEAMVITIHVWRTLPFAAVILLAGLTAIPKDITEAADIDGAGFWRQLFLIRLPLLLPIMIVAVLYGMVFTFTDIIVVYILTGGGPVDGTQVLPTWAYYKGVGGSDLAQGAAIALFLFPALVAIAILMLRAARRSDAN